MKFLKPLYESLPIDMHLKSLLSEASMRLFEYIFEEFKNRTKGLKVK